MVESTNLDFSVTAAKFIRVIMDQGCDGFVKHAKMTFVSTAFQKQGVNTSKEVNMTCSNNKTFIFSNI